MVLILLATACLAYCSSKANMFYCLLAIVHPFKLLVYKYDCWDNIVFGEYSTWKSVFRPTYRRPISNVSHCSSSQLGAQIIFSSAAC